MVEHVYRRGAADNPAIELGTFHPALSSKYETAPSFVIGELPTVPK